MKRRDAEIGAASTGRTGADHPIQRELEAVFESCRDIDGGAPADYIPELARVDPDRFAAAVCLTDGRVFSVGGARDAFTLQSMVKPFLYGTALHRFTPEAVHARVGVEPTGRPFDAMLILESGSKRPHNPMVNAGAIGVAGMFSHGSEREQVRRIRSIFSDLMGRENIEFDSAVYLSERDTGFGNRALAHLMHFFHMLDVPVETALDFYFKACAVRANCHDLAVMAATLANAGTHPLTGRKVLPAKVVRDVLTVMATCGLYDYAGRFWFDVGVPAKSGVCGGIFAVVPGRMGIAVFSPRLDENGNSVRGLSFLERLSKRRGIHVFLPAARAPVVVRPQPTRSAPLVLRWACTSAFESALCTTGGSNSDFYPELQAANPHRMAVAICTADGVEAAFGDADEGFTLQAAASPFSYALALQRHGMQRVHRKLGVEPSGNPFHAIHLDQRLRRPHNPLNNAGALTIASMLLGPNASHQLGDMLTAYREFAGSDQPEVDMLALASERTAGERNRAIAYLLRKFDIIPEVTPTLERYFLQNSVRVDCRLLARMGATLAAGGRNPITGRQVIDPDLVPHILTVMATCGMHDSSGQFAFDVGIPAKSAISGAIVAAVPGQMGIAVYSPPLDPYGTSVRGAAMLGTLARDLGLQMFTCPAPG
ncbi:glutaminase [Sulfidibacter corallicola]|uniref:Glutaminase n=1 Tax=Sulfidibacter corallicola TaxID=2818388 RepID=A0A8A4TSC9_SULCO|nr:glutaminase A [Sulfidibacter corallicola]QTD51948.1 glutaminase A [Sulfidibacter corallicola]